MSPLLADVLRRVYWPTILNRSGGGGCDQRRRDTLAVALFSEALGNAATVDDLTPENYHAFRELLTEKGIATRAHLGYRNAIRKLWEFCERKFGVEHQPPHDPPRRERERGPLDLERLGEWRSGRGITMPPPAPGTLHHFYELTYRPQCLIESPKSTLDQNRSLLIAIYRFMGRHVRVDELSDSFAADFFAALLAAGRSAWSINRHRAHLFAIWRFAAGRGLVAVKPTVRKLHVKRNAPDAWTIQELEILLAAAANHRPGLIHNGVAYSLLMPAMITLIFYTAIRRRTACELRYADLDVAGRKLTVRADSMKGRRGKRFALPQAAVEPLLRILDPPRALLFPITPAHFTKQFRAIRAASGLAPSVHRAGLAHKVRRSAATHATIVAGVRDACEMLGHSSEYVTKLYIDPSMLPDQQTGMKLPTLGGAGGNDLAEARELLAAGKPHLAAIAARIVLERKISARCEKLKERRPAGVAAAAKLLAAHRIIATSECRLLCRVVRVANRAAHGRAVDAAAVGELIEVVAHFAGDVNPGRNLS
jgi:integrase